MLISWPITPSKLLLTGSAITSSSLLPIELIGLFVESSVVRVVSKVEETSDFLRSSEWTRPLPPLAINRPCKIFD